MKKEFDEQKEKMPEETPEEILTNGEENVPTPPEEGEPEFLSDSVKALSPGRLVLKRFFRSKLSIVGLVMIAALFLFSWLGPLFSPWGETEIDYETDRYNICLLYTSPSPRD